MLADAWDTLEQNLKMDVESCGLNERRAKRIQKLVTEAEGMADLNEVMMDAFSLHTGF